MKKTLKILMPLVLAAVLVLGLAVPAMAASITGSSGGIYAIKGRVTDTVTKRGWPGEDVKVVITGPNGSAAEVYSDTLTSDSNGYYGFPQYLYADLQYGRNTYECTISIEETAKHKAFSYSYTITTPAPPTGVGQMSIVKQNIQFEAKTTPVAVTGGTFEGGGASGDLVPGQLVTLIPSPAPEGKAFDKWQCLDASGAVIEEWPYYSFNLPEGTVSVAAVYKDAPDDPNDGTDNNGGGTGSTDNSGSSDNNDNSGNGGADNTSDSNSSGDTSGGSGTKSPKTGGEADTALFLMLMGIATAGIAVSASMLRKHAKSGR
ncbi:hypothetical protein [Christensenella intestinihominis]|uniref:hypothetical protein n=1 Tax=Christensenella intestinihominis TaxID=1851429 RepID=UPI00082F0700|nr:hypothetical protein [Christensenella intestinihominis]